MELHVKFSVVQGDAFQCPADVLVLKFARKLYGLDRAIFSHLTSHNIRVELPELGDSELIDTQASIQAKHILFLGVRPLWQFGYTEIREFARLAMQHLSVKAPNTRSIALTIHGPGYGLDEVEAFEAELAGVVEAINAHAFPAGLESVIFVERDHGRVSRLSEALSRIVPETGLPFNGRDSLNRLGESAQTTLRTAGYSSLSKAHVFVAMPFAKEMVDVFHYGIQGAVHSQGLLCERADLSAFTGDVLDWVKQRISSASLVIADLSTANPNVYLEVGYAWGCQVPTVLLSKTESDLKFDVRSQRCILYDSIQDLEKSLREELIGLTKG